MGRRKTIPETIDAKFFVGVTPLWHPPTSASIPERYHEAVYELARWAGPGWAQNDETDFFLIRNLTVRSCEAWRAYEWNHDRAIIAHRKDDRQLLKAPKKLSFPFRQILGGNRFNCFKIQFTRIFLASLKIPLPDGTTNGQAIDAFDEAFSFLAEAIDRGDKLPARFGALEYDTFPKSLPTSSVALALVLADQITFFRRDGHQKGTLSNPHEPHLSPQLPWKAIAYFAAAAFDAADETLSEFDVQQRVESLAKSVSLVWWCPPKSINRPTR
jgi:hypothetical protein